MQEEKKPCLTQLWNRDNYLEVRNTIGRKKCSRPGGKSHILYHLFHHTISEYIYDEHTAITKKEKIIDQSMFYQMTSLRLPERGEKNWLFSPQLRGYCTQVVGEIVFYDHGCNFTWPYASYCNMSPIWKKRLVLLTFFHYLCLVNYKWPL